MNYLLDTNVLSEARRKNPDASVTAWLNSTPETSLFLSVLVLGEVRKGIAKLRDEVQRQVLQRWLDTDLIHRFGERLLLIDADTALLWGRLSGEGEARGEPLPVVDTLLAATALRHNFTLVTRNVQDFSRYPVQVLNPWTLPRE